MLGLANKPTSVFKSLSLLQMQQGCGDVLGMPGDVYIITDTRKNPRKELDQMRSLQRYGVKPYTPVTAFASESGTVLFPVKDLHFDRKNFQNRETDFSDESVLKIIKAVKDGKFNWAAFDAITIWQNPADGKFYVLSGHSRSEAFKRLAEMGESADGKNFTKIPAKIFKGSLDEARDLALNSNTLSTKETNFERANYYRALYNSEIAKGRSKAEATNLIMPVIKEREGKNANSIFYISFLNPTGIFYDALRQLQNAPTQDRERLKVVGEWVGRLRKDRSKLTDFHERELFDYLITQGNYNKTVTNYADLLKRIDTALLKMVDEKGNFQPERSLNLKKNIVAEGNEKAFLQELDRLKRVAADDENLYNQKLAEFRNRQKVDPTITDEQILKAVEPYRQRAILSKADYNAFRQKRAQYIDADRRQTSLFGLGKLGDKYVITDLREKSKKDLTDIKNISRAKINIEPYSAENSVTESVYESVTASNVAMTDGGVKIQVDGNKFVVTSPYSTEFVKVARNFGGKWNGNGWVFANSEMPDIKKKLLEIYGSDGTLQPAVTLLVKNLSDRSDINSGYELFNIPIARAYGRDSGARLNSNIILIDGEITSDGSMKHPYTRLKEATFRIKDVPKALINNNIYLANAIKDGWVEVVENEGLGKPTIKFEFEDNADLMNFFAKSDGNGYSNAQNVDFENVATSTASNVKRGASRTQSAITTPETLYLPYSEGSKVLPGSANPKSLPPASQNIPPLTSVLKPDGVFVNHRKIGDYGYINDNLKYINFYIDKEYMVNDNIFKWSERIFPHAVIIICFKDSNGIWKFFFQRPKYKHFIYKKFPSSSIQNSGIKYFIFDLQHIEKVIQAFESEGYPVVLVYRNIVEDINDIPQPSSPKALPPSGIETDETFIPFGYEKITDEKVIQRFNERRNILNNSGLIPVSDIISVIEIKPSVIFTTAGTDGIKKYKFKGKEDGEFIFEAVNDNGEPIPGEVNLRFSHDCIDRLNALKSWFINPESTPSLTAKDWENAAILKSLLEPTTAKDSSPDWAAIYKRLVDSHQWNSFDPESAAEYDVKIFRNAYNNVIAELPENRKADFTQKFIAKVYEIARLNAAAPSAAVTGRGGITAKKAAKYNAANDRYMQARADFSEWLNNYAERAAKIEERERKAAMNAEERRDERFETIKKDIDYFSALLKNRAQVPSYRISNARQNLQSKLETEAYKGNVETITKLLDYMRPLNVFTNRSSVWQLADLAQRRRAKHQKAEKAFEEQNADENADYKIEFDENEDRVKIYFNGIPSENIRTWLKQHNFRWSPRNKAWQRQITVDSRNVVNKFNSMMKSGEFSGLGKPTVKFEFEDNDEIFKTFGSGVSGLTVNDKPAALFNCPEYMLQCKGFTPSYIPLDDYSSLIEPAKGEKNLIGYGFEVATLNELANACNHWKDVARLASHLKADNVLQSAFNVWHWLHTNIRYNYDTPGEEEIRTPARSWADRENGVDCDCIAVFTACLLGAMGYKPKFEIVAFNNSPKFSHIYVNLDGAAIDRVLPVFLARPENITKTKIMDIPVFELSGTADGGFSTLNGIYADTLLKVNSGTANAQDSMDLRKTQVLLGLQKSDPQAYKLAAILMPYVVAIDDNGSYYFANDKVAEIAENADKKLYSLKISGANQAAFDEFFNSIVGEMKNISVRLERGEGKTVVTISFTNPQNDTYNVEGEYVKKDMLAINPDFLTMRNALKNLIAVNYYDLATRFAVGLMTEKNAVQAGYTPETWQKAVEATNKLKKLWTLLGGDVETLIQVIESGAEKEPVVEIDGDTSIIETSAFDSVLHGCKYNALSGINGLGETSTVNSELDTLGEGFETLLEWIAEIEPGNTVNISITKTSDGESNIRYASTMPQNGEKKNKAWLWLLGGAVVGSGIAAATSGKKNKKSKR